MKKKQMCIRDRLNPIYVFLDKKFLPWLTNNTINPPACRGLAIIVTYALTGGVLYLFSALVFPQIIISVSNIIGNLRSYADSLQQLLDMITHLVTVDGMPPEIVHAMEMSVENVINQIYDLVLNSVPHVLDYAMNFTSGLFSLIIGIIISDVYKRQTLDCAGLLEQFDTYVPVTPLVYRQGGAVVSPSFQAKMTPISQDIFYNIDEWQ